MGDAPGVTFMRAGSADVCEIAAAIATGAFQGKLRFPAWRYFVEPNADGLVIRELRVRRGPDLFNEATFRSERASLLELPTSAIEEAEAAYSSRNLWAAEV